MRKNNTSLVRAISLAIGLVLILGNTLIPALAATSVPDVQPYYTSMSRFNSSLTIASDGRATACGMVSLNSNASSCTITLELQKYSENGWTTEKAWDPTTYNLYYISQTKYWYVASGYNYRLKISAIVFDSNGNVLETETELSENVYY